MTTEKMPDVIWAERNIHQYYDAYDEIQHIQLEKYLRAEHVEELLKHVRLFIVENLYEDETIDVTNAIDQFLGETK